MANIPFPSGPTDVYIVFTATELHMGRFIRLMTKSPFNHVSIALEPSLQPLYAFARYHLHAPLVGGFVTETPARFESAPGPVRTEVYHFCADTAHYARIKQNIESFQARRQALVYNSLGALASLFKRKLLIEDAFTCVEFAAFLLELDAPKGGHTIESLRQALGGKPLYKGCLHSLFRVLGTPIGSSKPYVEPLPHTRILQDTGRHFQKLLARLYHQAR